MTRFTVKIQTTVTLAAVLVSGIILGWIWRSAEYTRKLSVDTIATHAISLTDGKGRKRAELKADGEKTYLIFFDAFNRPRLTLDLDGRGPSITLNGREDTNKILLSVNDTLRTASIFTSALTSAINLVGGAEAKLKLSDSMISDARSASLDIGPRVTKLRLSSSGAESEIWAENDPKSGKSEQPRSVELAMRTSQALGASLRVSSEDRPSFELWKSGAKTCSCPLSPR